MTRSKTDSPTTALGNSGYQSAGDRLEVSSMAPAGPADPFADELVKIVCLGQGKVPHGEVVDHETAGLARRLSRAAKLRSAWPPASSASRRLQVTNMAS